MADHVITQEKPEGWQLPGLSTPMHVEPGVPCMRRQNDMTHEEVIAYNLRGGGNEFTVFEYAQPDRVQKARAIIDKIISLDHSAARVIVEPGCSAGDISGFFATPFNRVVGIDVTPGAAAAARDRWPEMEIIEAEVESVEPIPCDILVLCEFMEHITDPVGFARAWMPLARYVVIGHPLVGNGGDPEPGHPWAYFDVDFANWFPTGDHELVEAWEFPMGYRMVIGWGKHR